jgi:ribonuclease HII
MKLPNFSFEKALWEKEFKIIAGIDEVGRGSFAGPVVAGVVVFKKNQKINLKEININDSKKLTAKVREKGKVWIKKNALTWGIGKVGVGVINKLGITKATKMAFRRAIANANRRLAKIKKIDYLLIDAFFVPYVPCLPARKGSKCRQTPIIHGDEKSFSIAAASIIAKVYRDKLMVKLDKKYKGKYGWGKNKGYGTKEHRESIKKYGLTRLHRKAFVKNFL